MNLSKYYKTLDAIKETAARKQQIIKLSDQERQTAREKYAAASHEERVKMNNEILEREKANDAIRQHNAILEVQILALKNNALLDLLQDVAPVVADVLKRYAGKKYGPKTKDTIKAASGVELTLNSRSAYIWTEGCRFELYAAGAGFLDSNNAVLAVEADNMRIYGANNYIPDPDAYARNMINARAELCAQAEALYNAVVKYNEAAVDGLPALPYPRTINTNIFYC